ncbi:hypothetical protein HRM2_39830 [Desulforapulum autotrophicum HRM2]|uniref:Uncharacterized protein n=2 Tax=Desulforapulum autotrophicum TaxID=2296 RepID=C0QBN9_DESAH|nr:hypothetical protein HRM2_39830 [Desulforapulum autotrophicum HRM2]
MSDSGFFGQGEDKNFEHDIKIKVGGVMVELTQTGKLRIMYGYTFLGAGGFGLGIIMNPDLIQSLLKMPDQDPVIFGITGAVYLAFGFLSIFGLISPIKFSPVLFLQLIYKSLWLAGVIAPMFLKGQFPFYAVLITIIFLTYIIGDLITLPFNYLFSKSNH